MAHLKPSEPIPPAPMGYTWERHLCPPGIGRPGRLTYKLVRNGEIILAPGRQYSSPEEQNQCEAEDTEKFAQFVIELNEGLDRLEDEEDELQQDQDELHDA